MAPFIYFGLTMVTFGFPSSASYPISGRSPAPLIIASGVYLVHREHVTQWAAQAERPALALSQPRLGFLGPGREPTFAIAARIAAISSW